MKKEKTKKKWKKKKRCLLECLLHKRVVYTQVNWEWDIGNNNGAIWYPCFPAHIFYHTYQLGQSNFQYLCHPLYSTGAIRFHPHPCHPIFVTLPRQTIFHTNFTIPLVHKNWGNCKAYFPSRRVLYTILIFFRTKLFIPSKLHAHIGNSTHQNWGLSKDLHSRYLSNTLNSLNTYPLSMGSSYTILTLASNVLGFLKNGSWYLVNSTIIKNFWFCTLKFWKRKTFAHIFTLQLVHIFETLCTYKFLKNIYCT